MPSSLKYYWVIPYAFIRQNVLLHCINNWCYKRNKEVKKKKENLVYLYELSKQKCKKFIKCCINKWCQEIDETNGSQSLMLYWKKQTRNKTI